MSRVERRALVERAAPALPVSRQCRLLSVSRASVYRRPAEISEEDCTIMALIDRQYLARPYYGSRRMAAWLATQGHVVNRKRVRRLMRLMGLVAIYQRPNTSKPAAAHKIYPYLLGGIDRTGQSGLVFGRHLHPNGQGLPLSGGRHGLGEPCGAGVAVVEHPRRRVLCRGARGSTRALRPARDLQYRPGQPVHQRRLHRHLEAPRDNDQHGWQGALHGQHLRRATVAEP